SRGDADEYEKESVHDFALWKAPKEGEPFWETVIGPGRPGWHIECSAMSVKYLGKTFDLHCGGVDNIFPHHENEIAQSEAANGVKFVNTWLHCHHLVVDGEKMSKSKGNFYRLADVLAKGYDPLDVRYLLLSTHYRKMLNFTFEALEQAKAARQRMGNFLADVKVALGREAVGKRVDAFIKDARAGFEAGLDDDLNISEGLAAVFILIKNVYPLVACEELDRDGAAEIIRYFEDIDRVLAVKPEAAATPSGRAYNLPAGGGKYSGTGRDVELFRTSGADKENRLEANVEALIEERQKARAAKDFKRADDIRKELLQMGIVLEDAKDGVRWKKLGPAKA
ncbi:MAG: CysS/YqeB C-terminal domain-containing protein, partial [Candidatus Aminicenantales bacterium]